MNADEIRRKYLDFFAARGHSVIARARLVPEGDPTTLFTGSGMQALMPYLLGATHPRGTRLTDSQTCVRAQDIDEVGDNRHTTFFEMLGNWSLGNYSKGEQLPWFYEFLTREVGLDPSRIYVSCFNGDAERHLPRDDDSAKIWQKLFRAKNLSCETAEMGSEEDGSRRGMKPGERIFFYGGDKNWWSRGAGIDGTPIGDPCGPDSEVFYEFADVPHDPKFGEFCHPNCDCGRFMEIGNSVFMEFRRDADGGFSELARKNVDFGGGLERIAAAAIDSPDVFRISLFSPIIAKLESLSGKDYDANAVAMRVIADHLRAAVFLATDGVRPSNKEQGYVMRRLIRRAVRFAFDLGIEQNFLEEIVPVIADLYVDDFPEVRERRAEIIAVLAKEEKAFRQTLRKGLKEFNKISGDGLTGAEIFTLYDTFGFPTELSVEEAFKRDIAVSETWRDEFDNLMKKQREMSQTAAKGAFKGGLGGKTWQHRRYHTATHLLQSALREIFGSQLGQHGSNINEERLRFDFNLDRKMTTAEISRAEELVNNWIRADLPIFWREYPTAEALSKGAIGPFGERYGEKVKVYQMGGAGSGFATDEKFASLEICGGPHCETTGQLATRGELNDPATAQKNGYAAADSSTDAPQNKPLELKTDFATIAGGAAKFRIVKEESVAAGMRRIKAILE